MSFFNNEFLADCYLICRNGTKYNLHSNIINCVDYFNKMLQYNNEIRIDMMPEKITDEAVLYILKKLYLVKQDSPTIKLFISIRRLEKYICQDLIGDYCELNSREDHEYALTNKIPKSEYNFNSEILLDLLCTKNNLKIKSIKRIVDCGLFQLKSFKKLHLVLPIYRKTITKLFLKHCDDKYFIERLLLNDESIKSYLLDNSMQDTNYKFNKILIGTKFYTLKFTPTNRFPIKYENFINE